MKIRIKGNSLRLRLTESEVETFERDGYHESAINIGLNSLTYALRIFEGDELDAEYKDDKIVVYIPEHMAETWTGTDLVGMNGEIELAGGDSCSLLVEKDFQCLKPRPGEDESDNFPNPLAEKMG